MIFTSIKKVELPKIAEVGEGFTIVMEANGKVPFAQVIVRHADGWEWIVRDQHVTDEGKGRYQPGRSYLYRIGFHYVTSPQSIQHSTPQPPNTPDSIY